eukprot:GHVU01025788.1.p1 GENE.GHVU01025788.1~~GHVU01025788.1.p1  ORF type:complete len:776 (-),score=83.75 GHVU01025788.1:201-2528(-)
MNVSSYPLWLHWTIDEQAKSNKDSGGLVWKQRYRCSEYQQGCPFGVILTHDTSQEEGAQWCLGRGRTLNHSHDPPVSTRTKRYEKEAVLASMDALRREGRRPYDCGCAVSNDIYTRFGLCYQPSNMSRMLRRRTKRFEATRMQNLAVDVTSLLELPVDAPEDNIGGTSTELVPLAIACESVEVRAAVGVLEGLRGRDPDAAIKVMHEGSQISCIFIATGAMRRKGYWHGKMLSIDDMKGVTSSQYNLASATVVTNQGRAEPAAIALMADGTTPKWEAFFAFAEKAFAAATQHPPRGWELVIADDDGVIQDVSRNLSLTTIRKVWNCAWHMFKAIDRRFLHLRTLYSPVRILMLRLMMSHEYWRYPAWETEIEELLNAISSEQTPDKTASNRIKTRHSLRMKLQKFFIQIKDSRRLCDVQVLSLGYTSQSVAESQHSRYKKLDVRPCRSVADTLVSIVSFAENLGVRDQKLPNARIPDAVAASANDISAFALRELLMPEVTASEEWVVTPQGGSEFRVHHRLAKNASVEHHVVRSGTPPTCTCNRSVVYGVPCRHVLACLAVQGKPYAHNPVLFNEQWMKVMPRIELAWKDKDMYLSPASSGAADSAASSAGGGAGVSALRSSTSAVPLVVQAAPATVGGCAISARQYKNDLSMRAQKFVDRIGHDRTKLQEFDLVLTAAEEQARPQQEQQQRPQLGLQTAHKRPGRAQEVRFREGVPKRANNVRKKGKYKCNKCGAYGHNSRTCRKGLASSCTSKGNEGGRRHYSSDESEAVEPQ